MKSLLPFVAVLLSLAPSALALTPAQLTPDELKQYDQIKSDPAAAAAYLDTRDFLRKCRQVESGKLAPKSLPVQPQDYNGADVSSAEQAIVDDAVFKAILATLG